jgi:hypothetical protein
MSDEKKNGLVFSYHLSPAAYHQFSHLGADAGLAARAGVALLLDA